jgi:predicted component of type VI protein secretion system
MGMKRNVIGTVALAIASAAVVSGCAGVSFYSDPELKKLTGIPVYAPKPYLLVARTGAKDKPVDVSIVYLNDTSKVVYAKPPRVRIVVASIEPRTRGR